MFAELSHTGFDSLLEAIAFASDEGFNVEFIIDELGFLDSMNDKFYYPEDVMSMDYIRIDGEYSDSNEESILYLIEMKNGNRGWVSDSYGIYADYNLAAHLKRLAA